MPVRFPQAHIELVGAHGELKNLTVPPNFIVGLTHIMQSMGGGNKVTVELFDKTWGILDLFIARSSEIVNGNLKILYRYGFGDELSEIREAEVIKIQPGTLSLIGVDLTIDLVDSGVVEAFTKEKKGDKKVYRDSIGNIVKQIAQKHSWSLDLLEPDPVFEYDGKQQKVSKSWVKGRMTDLEFLKFLTQFSNSSKYPGRYEVKVETDAKGKTTLSFRPPKNEKIYKTYHFMRDILGEVISFSPSLDNLIMNVFGGSGVEARGRDPLTKERIKTATNIKEHQSSVFLGNRGVLPVGAVASFLMESANAETSKKTIESYYAFLSSFVQKASMEIVGDVNIRPNDLIQIIVLTPAGTKYFTSGIWRVIRITNKVADGDFTSSLELIRNGVDIGSVVPEKAPKFTAKK